MDPIKMEAPYPRADAPCAILRPLKQNQWDSEYVTPEMEDNNLSFFVNVPPNRFHNLLKKKTKLDTTMQAPKQMSEPMEFSLFGFDVYIEAGIAAEDYYNIVNDCSFVFRYMGGREYLREPLLKFPGIQARVRQLELKLPWTDMRDPEKSVPGGVSADNMSPFAPAVPLTWEDAKKHLQDEIDELWEDRLGYVRFNIGKAKLRIRPTEAFGVTLEWPKAPKVSRPIRLTAVLVGLTWTAL